MAQLVQVGFTTYCSCRISFKSWMLFASVAINREPLKFEREESSQTSKYCFNLSPSGVKALVYFGSLILYIVAAVVFYCYYEGWTPGEALSFAIVTLATVGYGYHSPSDDKSRLFTIFFMLFGVYFVFAGINELIAAHMRNIAYQHEIGPGTLGEKYLATRRRFALNVTVIILVLLSGAFVLMACEGWTFVSALYFAIETTTTIGFGDMDLPKPGTRVFLCFYILISCGLVTYAFSNLHLMKNGLKVLNEDERRAQKRMSLEFMMAMDKGSGVTREEFLLAILQHQGIIKEKDIKPWNEKFLQLDVNQTGRVFKKELEVFHVQEAVLASSHLEEISRDRTASLTPLPLPILNAAGRALLTPWTSMDEGPVHAVGIDGRGGPLRQEPRGRYKGTRHSSFTTRGPVVMSAVPTFNFVGPRRQHSVSLDDAYTPMLADDHC